MTITTEVIKAGPFNGNDVTTSFAFASKTTAEGDLRVVWVETDGTESNLVLDTDYSVSLNADQDTSPGGTVTYPLAGDPLATGETLTIINEPTYTQGSDLRAGTGANVIEDALDRLTILTQRSKEVDDRTFKIPVSDPSSVVTELPAKDDRLEKYLYFDSNGDVSAVTASLIGSAVGVDETDTNTTKNKMTSNALAKRAEDTAKAIVGVQAASAVNQFQATNSAAAANLTLIATGNDAAISMEITPKGAGDLILDGLKWPQADGSANQLLQTNGSGQIGYANTPLALVTLFQPGFINGLQLSNGTDATNDIDIAVGACLDSTDATNIELSSIIVKQIDANWAVGSAAGGFPSGLTLTNDTWYHVFLIRRSDTGVVDAGFDTSLTATNLLTDATNYDSYRRIGSIYYGTATIRQFTQNGDRFDWNAGIINDLAGSGSTAGASLTITTPPDIVTIAHLSMVLDLTLNGVTRFGVLTPLYANNTAPSIAFCTVAERTSSSGDVWGSDTNDVDIVTDTSSAVRQRVSSNTGAAWYIGTRGWTDMRGKL